MMSLIKNREDVLAVAPCFLAAPSYDIQARLYMHLRGLRTPPWGSLLRRRVGLHLVDDTIDVESIMGNIVKANFGLPPKMVFAALRVLCNGIPTARRLQEDALPCRLCGDDEGDALEHLIHCPVVIIFLVRHFPCIRTLLGLIVGVSRSLLNRGLSL